MRLSRRALLALTASGGWAAERASIRPEAVPSEAKRYVDGATEFVILRHTAPTHSSLMTAPCNRGISNRGFLLYSSDRGGSLDVYRLDLKGGPGQRLTEATELDPHSIGLAPNDRSFCYMDGRTLKSVNLSPLRQRDVYTAEDPFDRVTACALNPEGTHACLVERSPDRSRLRMVSIARGTASTVVESADEIAGPLPRPGGGIAYRRGAGMFFAERNGVERVLTLAPGTIASGFWTPDGASLLYLHIAERQGELNTIREYLVAKSQDKPVSKTSQFLQFAPNADATVFAGASGSKASPHILILIRSVRRELTMCEHRARDAGSLAIAFSPNSQRVFFQSDQHGKPAIYSISVERFVEETES